MAHRNDDVRRLALKAAGTKGIDLPFALDQIAGWQTARRKLPSWAATEGIIYPPRLSMEQCSGETAARYKAAVARRLVSGGRFVDITGGFGVDFSFMARCFDEAVYVERQERLCHIAAENLRLLGLEQATVISGDGTGYVSRMEGRAAMIFADPARRDSAGGRTFAISDCTPNVLESMDQLLGKADFVMLKLSPMLDWRKAVSDIEAAVGGDRHVVREVHIVAVDNECKELLVVASAHGNGQEPMMYCVGENQRREERGVRSENSCIKSEKCMYGISIPSLLTTHPTSNVSLSSLLAPRSTLPWLYEPNAAIMKAGIFGFIEQRYGVRQIGPNSHLFVGSERVENFPGRCFRIGAVTPMNKRELRKALAGISKANVTVRNFPMTVDELRRKLKISDGGNIYIFATTSANGERMLLVCEKAT